MSRALFAAIRLNDAREATKMVVAEVTLRYVSPAKRSICPQSSLAHLMSYCGILDARRRQIFLLIQSYLYITNIIIRQYHIVNSTTTVLLRKMPGAHHSHRGSGSRLGSAFGPTADVSHPLQVHSNLLYPQPGL